MAHSPREPWPFALSISHPPYPHIRIYSYTCRIVRPPPLLRHRVAYWLAKLLAKYRSFSFELARGHTDPHSDGVNAINACVCLLFENACTLGARPSDVGRDVCGDAPYVGGIFVKAGRGVDPRLAAWCRTCCSLWKCPTLFARVRLPPQLTRLRTTSIIFVRPTTTATARKPSLLSLRCVLCALHARSPSLRFSCRAWCTIAILPPPLHPQPITHLEGFGQQQLCPRLSYLF